VEIMEVHESSSIPPNILKRVVMGGENMERNIMTLLNERDNNRSRRWVSRKF
jgi:hypothetical protein